MLLQAVAARIGDDNLTLVAAGIAFYALFAVFPALAAMISVFGLVGDTSVVQGQIAQLVTLMPPEAAKILVDALNALVAKSGTHLSWALAIGIAIALWSARAGISSLMTGLNIAYEEREKRSFVVQQAVALGLTLGAVLFGVAALVALAGIPLAIDFLPLPADIRAWLDYSRWPLLVLCLLAALTVIYRFAPSRSVPHWNVLGAGKIVAALLWVAGSYGFSIYVTRFGSYDATYGSLGAVVVLLLWFWMSAFFVLVGATLDAELGDVERVRPQG